MSHLRPLMTVSLAALIVSSARMNGQSASSAGPHVIVGSSSTMVSDAVRLRPQELSCSVAIPCAFLRPQGVMHNVHFTKQAAGAKLGGAATGPYLTTKGVRPVIDARFADGTYEFACEPHEAIGMKKARWSLRAVVRPQQIRPSCCKCLHELSCTGLSRCGMFFVFAELPLGFAE